MIYYPHNLIVLWAK